MKTLSQLNTALLQHNQAVLAQAAGIVRQHSDFSSPYSAHIGPHVRHILEHYQTLRKVLHSLADSAQMETDWPVDYDNRARDLRTETDPAFALQGLRELQQWLAPEHWRDAQLNQRLAVQLRGGLCGEHSFVSTSSVARELSFLSSHAVHHFAVLQGYARLEGKSFGAGLGKAPATIAHEMKVPTTPQTTPITPMATAA